MTEPEADRGDRGVGEGAAGRFAAGRSRRATAEARRSRRRSVTYAVLAGIAVFLVLVILDALWSARTMVRGVTSARSHLIAGTEEVVTGDPDVAAGSYADAVEAADAVIGAAGHPSMRLAGLLPFVGDNLDGVVAVATAERASAEAGLVLVQAANALGWDDILLPATSSLGEVDLARVERAAPLFDDVATRLRTALDELEAGGGGLVGPVATGYDDAVTALERRAALAGDAARLTRLLPSLLGGTEPRRYLVAVERLGSTAPAGGEVGAVGVLTATEGSVGLEPLEVAPPAMADATATAHGPDVAAALVAGAGGAGLAPIDGVLLADTVGLQQLLWMTGDVEVAGRPQPLRFEDAIDALEREPFLGPDRAAGEARQAELATATIASALGRRPSTEAFAIGSAGAIADRHLVLFSTRKREQALIRGLGAAGVTDPGRNPLGWTATSAAANLAGTYSRWVTTSVVTIEEDGTARVKTTVELDNRAPSAPPSALLGRAFGTERVGAWAADVRVRLPEGADHVSGETSTPSETVTGEDEFGQPYLAARLAADPGGAMSVIVSYRRPAAADVEDGAGLYRMRILPQPLAFPGIVRIRIVLPEGTTLTDASDAFERGSDVARFEGSPTAPIDLFVRYD